MSNKIFDAINALRYLLSSVEQEFIPLLREGKNKELVRILASLASSKLQQKLFFSGLNPEALNDVRKSILSTTNMLMDHKRFKSYGPLYLLELEGNKRKFLPVKVSNKVIAQLDQACLHKEAIKESINSGLIHCMLSASHKNEQSQQNFFKDELIKYVDTQALQRLLSFVGPHSSTGNLGSKRFPRHYKIVSDVIRSSIKKNSAMDQGIHLDVDFTEVIEICIPQQRLLHADYDVDVVNIYCLILDLVSQVEQGITESGFTGKLALQGMQVQLSKMVSNSHRDYPLSAALKQLIDFCENLHTMSIEVVSSHAMHWQNEKLRINHLMTQAFDTFKKNCLSILKLGIKPKNGIAYTETSINEKSTKQESIVDDSIEYSVLKDVQVEPLKTVDVNVVISEEYADQDIVEERTENENSAVMMGEDQSKEQDACFYLPEDLLACSGLDEKSVSKVDQSYQNKETGFLSLDSLMERNN